MKRLLPLVLFMVTTTLMAQPVITKNPLSKTVCVDTCAVFTVQVNSSAQVSYQWQEDMGSGFADIANATTSSYQLCPSGMTAPDSWEIRCVVMDINNNMATSNNATVTIDSCLAPVANFTYTFELAEVCFTNTSKNTETIIWNFGNNVVDNSNNDTPCNDYGTPWIYDVTLFATNAYGSDEITKTIDLVGLQEISSQYNTYPNPVNDVWNIQGKSRIARIVVIDMLGNVVMMDQPLSTRAQLDMSQLPSGVYQVVLDTEQQRLTQKIVKR